MGVRKTEILVVALFSLLGLSNRASDVGLRTWNGVWGFRASEV